jgi:hypothetical protein
MSTSLHASISTALHTPQDSTSHVDMPPLLRIEGNEIQTAYVNYPLPWGRSVTGLPPRRTGVYSRAVRVKFVVDRREVSLLKVHFPLSITIKTMHQCLNGTHPPFGRVTTNLIQAAASQRHTDTPPHPTTTMII